MLAGGAATDTSVTGAAVAVTATACRTAGGANELVNVPEEADARVGGRGSVQSTCAKTLRHALRQGNVELLGPSAGLSGPYKQYCE